MRRRFNYTDRKRITLDRISIDISKKDNNTEYFTANIKLDDMALPDSAKVYVEAYHRTNLMRYGFGSVGVISSPEDTDLSQLANYENLRFRIIVVDESNERGLLLASADKIRPTAAYLKRSILPVSFDDLGRQVWKVDYSGDEPLLLLNERIPNIHNVARTDPRFRLFVYPAVVREIFTYMFLIDKVNDIDEPEQEWHINWLRFAKRFITDDSFSQAELYDDEFNSDDVLNWIDKIVDGFCSSLRKEWLKLLSLEEVG